MTREETIKYFKRHLDLYCVDGISREAEEMAIKSLSQEPCTDAVSREAVREILTKYRLGESRIAEELNELPSVTPQPCNDAISLTKEAYSDLCLRASKADDLQRALNMEKGAYNALVKNIQCDDAISREELLKAIDTWDKFGYTETGCFVRITKEIDNYVPYVHLEDVITAIQKLPPVTQKSGKWITKPHVYGVTYCSECDFELKIDDTNYCPNCGCRMVEPQERSE